MRSRFLLNVLSRTKRASGHVPCRGDKASASDDVLEVFEKRESFTGEARISSRDRSKMQADEAENGALALRVHIAIQGTPPSVNYFR